MTPPKSSAKKHKFVKAWMQEHLNDPYVQEAKRRGFRSRAAFKLIELAERDKLLRPGMTAVDLGSSPGSWSQVSDGKFQRKFTQTHTPCLIRGVDAR